MNVASADKDVYEILDEVVKIKGNDKRVEHIAENYLGHNPLKYIVKFNYCNTINSLLPKGPAPFNKTELDGPSRANLWSYLQMFPMFVQGPTSQNVPALKIENMFIEMLEAISPQEAEMVCLVKDKQLTTKWDIDVSVWQTVFPDMVITP